MNDALLHPRICGIANGINFGYSPHSMTTKIDSHEFPPSNHVQPIIGIQTPRTRALNVGYIKKNGKNQSFVPCRLNLGALREKDTYDATVQTLLLPKVQKILKRYTPNDISTVTILRESIALGLPTALYDAGIRTHYGDCYIGANHIKTKTSIITNYAYENIEGLNPQGLWVVGDSIAEGRNLIATMSSLLPRFHPKEILMIVPIGNRLGINNVGKIFNDHGIPATFIVWGALFGLEPTMHYDEPWGLPDCEPIDRRDQKTFIDMYGPGLCVGGDFGNDYYCPPVALKLYKDQLRDQKITPKIPSVSQILKIYTKDELIIR